MEALILICLIIIIFLLISDKIDIKVTSKKKQFEPDPPSELPQIMGAPKSPIRKFQPKKDQESHLINNEPENGNLASETIKSEPDIENVLLPQEEPNESQEGYPEYDSFDVEEDDLITYSEVDSEFGYATGVTFEEIGNIGILLQKETLEPQDEKQAIEIVQKIQGTELLELLETSIEDASRKIAQLLEKSFPDNQKAEFGSSNLSDFDIENFI